ncbi:hypothetical protein KVT40_006259 [Elsinoe batatas]|uniref:Uncharacterized protein n=1 Tax=Elsinoe batatas TaxID=2601811 RepID=A0A8K0PG07_9PEZI|nr:hypothetical protein KVT40_006259 [Elsinoe batatas]
MTCTLLGKLQYCVDEVGKANEEDSGERIQETTATPADTPASNPSSSSSCPKARPATPSRASPQITAEDKPDIITTSTNTDDPEWELLINLYLLGHFLLDLPFTNKVIDAMINKWHADQRWPCGYAGLVFRETGEDTPLRRLIVDFHIYMGLGRQTEQETFDTDGDEVLFLKEVNRALGKLKWDRFEHEWFERPEPWEEDGYSVRTGFVNDGQKRRVIFTCCIADRLPSVVFRIYSQWIYTGVAQTQSPEKGRRKSSQQSRKRKRDDDGETMHKPIRGSEPKKGWVKKGGRKTGDYFDLNGPEADRLRARRAAAETAKAAATSAVTSSVTSTATIGVTTSSEEDHPEDEEWSLMVDLYLLAQFLIDDALASHMTEAMMTKFRAEHEVPLYLAERIYDNTAPDDPLRKMLVDLHIYSGRGKQIEEGVAHMDGDNAKEFLLDAFQGMRDNMVHNQDHKWLRDSGIELLEPWEADTCRYHDHKTSEEQRKCKSKTR